MELRRSHDPEWSSQHLQTLQRFQTLFSSVVNSQREAPLANLVQLSCKFGQRGTTYKPYSCSAAAEKHWFSWHLQTLQLFPRNRKTTISLTLTNPTVVPTQQNKKFTTELNWTGFVNHHLSSSICHHHSADSWLTTIYSATGPRRVLPPPWDAWSADYLINHNVFGTCATRIPAASDAWSPD